MREYESTSFSFTYDQALALYIHECHKRNIYQYVELSPSSQQSAIDEAIENNLFTENKSILGIEEFLVGYSFTCLGAFSPESPKEVMDTIINPNHFSGR